MITIISNIQNMITVISNIRNMNTPKSSGIIGSDDVLVVLENVELIFYFGVDLI